jgi:hypothetical protein
MSDETGPPRQSEDVGEYELVVQVTTLEFDEYEHPEKARNELCRADGVGVGAVLAVADQPVAWLGEVLVSPFW